MLNRRRSLARRSAFTLLEILIVVAIIVVVAGIGGMYLFGSLEKGKIDTAKVQMTVIEKAIKEFRLNNNGRDPQSLEMLLNGDPARDGAPYFEDIKSITDPWGNIYIFEPGNALKPNLGFNTPNGQFISNQPQQQNF